MEAQQPQPPDLQDLRRVFGIVRGLVPKHVDSESLAVDILLESWSNNHAQPAIVFIRNRCRDAIRALERQNQVTQDYARHTSASVDPEIEAGKLSLVKTLISVLSPTERKVIWYRFYCDLPTTEIAKRTGLSVADVRGLLGQSVFKMKQAAWE